MNLKEKLEAKEAELKAFAPQIEEGDEECTKSSEALAEEIKGVAHISAHFIELSVDIAP